MAEDPVTGEALDLRGRVVQDADRHFRDPSAALTADVLVMVLAQLEARVAFAQVDAIDQALPLEQAHGAEDRGVVGRPE